MSAILICDRSGAVLQASAAAMELYGRDVRARRLTELSPPDQRARIEQGLEEAFVRGERKESLVRDDGNGRSLLVGVEWTAIEIGAQRCLLEVSAPRGSAEVPDEVRDFAYVASHELMEPVRTICCFAAFLAERSSELGEEEQRYLANIRSGSERLASQVAALLRYSRIFSSTSPFEVVSLDRVFAATVERMLTVHGAGDAVVERDALGDVHADPRQVEVLAECLIDNALKFHGSAPSRVEIKAAQAADAVRISVSDNGIGIQAVKRPEALKLFRQLERRGGIGAGLPMATAIVARHGGRLWLEETQGGGVTVSFTLPR